MYTRVCLCVRVLYYTGMGLGFGNKKSNLPIERRSRELARGVWGHDPPRNFFNRYSLLQSGSIKIHMYCTRKNNNLTFLRKNTIYDGVYSADCTPVWR